MYGYYGAGYDLGDYEGDDMDMGELDGVMDVLKKDVAFGIPVWGVLAGLAGLALFTKKGKSVLGGLMGTAKKNPRRRRSRKAVSGTGSSPTAAPMARAVSKARLRSLL
jgi:hypothetical protein